VQLFPQNHKRARLRPSFAPCRWLKNDVCEALRKKVLQSMTLVASALSPGNTDPDGSESCAQRCC
jgi:hypothetical protein